MIPFNNMASLVEAVDRLEWLSNAERIKLIDAWKCTKRCCRCKEWRRKWYFSPYKKSVDGLDGKCKMCDSKRNKAAYAKRKAKA